MLTKTKSWSVRWPLVLVTVMGLVGCSKKEEPAAKPEAAAKSAADATAKTATEAVGAAKATLSEGSKGILAKADALDGSVDKIIAKCASCLFTMDGVKEHAFEIDGYTLRFCSDTCMAPFKKEPDKMIAGVKMPEATLGDTKLPNVKLPGS